LKVGEVQSVDLVLAVMGQELQVDAMHHISKHLLDFCVLIFQSFDQAWD
jgi:hypothetical protein